MNRTMKMLFFSLSCVMSLHASNCDRDYGLGSVYVVPVQEDKILFSQPAYHPHELLLPSVAICEGETFDAMAKRALWRSGLHAVAVYGARENENDVLYIAEIKPLSYSWLRFVKDELPQGIIALSPKELSETNNNINVKKALIFSIYDQYQSDKKAGLLKPCDVTSKLY